MVGKAEDERKPGTLNFLSPEEQLRVQRLLDICEERTQADATTQVPNVPFVSTGTQTVPVPTTKMDNTVSCNCLEMVMKNQEQMKEMLCEFLKKRIPGSPQTSGSPDVTDLSTLNCIFVEPFNEASAPNEYEHDAPSDYSEPPATPTSVNTLDPYLITTPNFTSSNTQIMAPNSSSPQMFDDVFKRSSSMPNYAKNLVFELFRQDELIGKNCAGVKGKQGISSDPRMDSVREHTFKRYRVTDSKAAWALCRKAIDTALRKMKISL